MTMWAIVSFRSSTWYSIPFEFISRVLVINFKSCIHILLSVSGVFHWFFIRIIICLYSAKILTFPCRWSWVALFSLIVAGRWVPAIIFTCILLLTLVNYVWKLYIFITHVNLIVMISFCLMITLQLLRKRSCSFIQSIIKYRCFHTACYFSNRKCKTATNTDVKNFFVFNSVENSWMTSNLEVSNTYFSIWICTPDHWSTLFIN